MGRYSNNTLGWPKNSLLQCYSIQKKIVFFHFETCLYCSEITCPWRHVLDSLRGAVQFAESTSICNCRTNLFAALRHMEVLSSISILFHFCCILCAWNLRFMQLFFSVSHPTHQKQPRNSQRECKKTKRRWGLLAAQKTIDVI